MSEQDEDLKQRAEKDLNKLRRIINEQAIANQNQAHKAQARDYVAEVITEAINDRQQKDASISRVLRPIVEESVEHSAKHHSKQLVDHLYPLIGDLVRKFVAAFVRDFIEKTNDIIENSVSIKSINWRYKAWRSGVSFPHYVASQTYLFKIHQVLLIHRETGLLLNSASAETFADENADLVSSMLSAINDFVNDSFQERLSGERGEHSEHNLDEIKTDDFTLFLRRGPHALLVAAVSGNISPSAKKRLQATLEYIHAIHAPDLKAFQGDNTPFYPLIEQLEECLLSEQINEDKKQKPWPAIALVCVGFIALFFWLFIRWETSHALQKLNDLQSTPGIVLTSAEIAGLHKINATIMRDPVAISSEEWLLSTDIPDTWITLTEQAYVSLAPDVLSLKLKQIVAQYPDLQFDRDGLKIEGELNSAQLLMLNKELAQVPGFDANKVQQNIIIRDNSPTKANASQIAMTIIAGEISTLQIDFDLASSELKASESLKLALIIEKLQELNALAALQGLRAKLLILGTSDNVGSASVNRVLSIERAQNVSVALQRMGLNKTQLMTAGLGIIDDASSDTNIRKAILNVVYNPINE